MPKDKTTKKLTFMQFLCSVFSLICLTGICHSFEITLIGVEGSILRLGSWNTDHAAWEVADFIKSDSNFPLYKGASTGLNINSTATSPDRKYLLIQRTVFGELNDSQQITSTEKSYCDMVAMDTGCVLLTRPAEACSGSWKNGNWSTDGGEVIEPRLETVSPKDLIKSTSAIEDVAPRAIAIKDQIYMGAGSYVGCYPPAKNAQALNDLGVYLAEAGDNASALKIYRGVESVGKRTVLMLNIADSLWSLKKTSEAIDYYKQYAESMNAAGKNAKIPTRVAERIRQ
ncbi:tetratricopeptide repeat protein [Pseudomonas cichorii]|nr:tetratricopeptide repeat protein [Pseudomonas cichorii]MBX8488622.1 tetratricopeptide repeat protein [Pseudomonas cichorii]MBX8510448.1 tetratricopeptide repeat protein [Pseudomonas cichorii]MBX8518764.1 tetratricopeptide repeat protein [Pseudomonas cichorii]MBX8600660.1 tetratricopeptide repeat protein [Pseudomonas cichorii]